MQHIFPAGEHFFKGSFAPLRPLVTGLGISIGSHADRHKATHVKTSNICFALRFMRRIASQTW